MTPATPEFEQQTYRKITRRLIPFLFVCYVLAYVDRVNVGFAKLHMQQDLGMSDAVYGLGAGIFFIGYFIFEVPANMILQKIGARLWLGPIMIAWGIVSAATLFAQGPNSFYALRFLLGIVESGFFPGVILYLTYWYTRKHRARMVAGFMAANPISGVLAGPVSGWILVSMMDTGGLKAWQWLFLLEGIPSVLAGVVALFYLVDSPAKAKWLTAEERGMVLRRLEEEEETKRREGESRHRLMDAFKSGKVWLLSLIYFGAVAGNYGLWFWLPQVIKDTLTADPLRIGWISAIPWGTAAVVMVLYGRHSDATGERRWHLSLALLFGAAAFSVSALPGISGVVGLAALTCSVASVMCGQSLFWALPTAMLSGTAAAAGIAWINSIGNLGGYVSPSLIGIVRESTGSMALALLALAGFMLMSSLLVMAVARPRKG